MRVTFAEGFDFNPEAFKGRVTVAYRAGETYVVTRECAEKARQAGKLKASPRRASDDEEQT